MTLGVFECRRQLPVWAQIEKNEAATELTSYIHNFNYTVEGGLNMSTKNPEIRIDPNDLLRWNME
jgi:hypothetical protein